MTSTKMDPVIQKSKMEVFIPKIKECAYFTEQTRRDYLRECSEYYDQYLNDYLMKEKRFWMKNEEMKVELDIRDKNDADEDAKKRCRKLRIQQESEEEQQQQESKKKKRKRRSTGRPVGRPRIHPKKERMCFTMEDLRSKASDPFGAKRVKKPPKREKKRVSFQSNEDAAAVAAAGASE